MELPWEPGFASTSAVVQGRLHVVTYKNVTDSDAYPQFVWVSGWGCVGLGWVGLGGWSWLGRVSLCCVGEVGLR